MFKDIFTISGRWGRLNRKRYLLYSLSLLIPVITILFLFVLINTLLSPGIDSPSYSFVSTASAQLIDISDQPIASTQNWNLSDEENQEVFSVESIRNISNFILYFLGLISSIMMIWGSICLGVKRLHDLNKSGWFILFSFIPIISFLLGIYMLFFKGTDGENQFGKDPLSVS